MYLEMTGGEREEEDEESLVLRSKLPLLNDAFDLSIDRCRKG
jgi:hypothetical protein